jgi:hypothetical protein
VLKLEMGSNGKPQMRQIPMPPFVYIDHWALQKIAQQAPDRFVAGLQRHNGTLCLSWANFLHLAETSGASQAESEALLVRVIPDHVIFTDSEPGSVIEKEDAIGRGERLPMPYFHADWASLFVNWDGRKSVNPLDPVAFLEGFHSPALRASLRQIQEDGRASMARMFEELRTRARPRIATDESRMIQTRLARAPRPAGTVIPPTRYFNELAMKHLGRGNQNIAEGDHMRDFWHTVVPISYFNYVALDTHWFQASTHFQKVLERARILTHRATLFSDHEDLLARLDGPPEEVPHWNPPASAPTAPQRRRRLSLRPQSPHQGPPGLLSRSVFTG